MLQPRQMTVSISKLSKAHRRRSTITPARPG